MTSLLSILIDYLEEEAWRYEIIEGETIVRFQFKASSGRLLCFAEVDEEKKWLIFYSYLPVCCPQSRIIAMAEFITRANRGMRIGNFELDFEDGEIRYKTSIDVEGGELRSKMIDNLLRSNLSTMNRYFDGMMKLIYADNSPAELIEGIESQSQPIIAFENIEDNENDDEVIYRDEDDDDDESPRF